MSEMRNMQKVLVVKLKGKSHTEDLEVDARWIVEGRVWKSAD
jgi:hypothetical protein